MTGNFPGAAPGAPLPVGTSGIPGMNSGKSIGPCPPGAQPVVLDNSPNAFECEEPNCCSQGCYVVIGAMGMTRQRLTHSQLATVDPGITLADGTKLFADTGNLPPRFAPQAIDMADIRPNFNWGVRATIGYRFDDSCAFELSGYYLFQNDSFRQVSAQNRVDLPFDTFPTPLGFQGDNGLWSQADVVRASLQTTLASAEGNFRLRSGGYRGTGIDWLFGIRFVDQQERFKIYTGDDDLTPATFDINGNPDPRVQATYSVLTHNRILAPQIGTDAQIQLRPWLTLGLWGKGAWGVNFLETDMRLIRGDGFVGFNTKHNQIDFAQLYESNIYLDVCLLERLHLRGGYNLLWLVGVAEANKQIDFNLANTFGTQRHGGSVFYHGPTMELQFIF
jgi:hypothetical protein